jgi:hypothetical protein
MSTTKRLDPRPRRVSRGGLVVTAAALACATPAVLPLNGAWAATAKSNPLAAYQNCPTNIPQVSDCMVATIESGGFTLGSISASVTQPITIQLGLEPNGDGGLEAIVPDNGTPAMSSTTIWVPGGIPGLLGIKGFPTTGNALDAGFVPSLDGPVTVNVQAMASQTGPAFSMPLSASMVNEFISSSCHISPIDVDATDGTTTPPPGVAPLTGSLGSLTLSKDGVINIAGMTLVSNTFSVPDVQSCNLLNLVPIDAGLDYIAGLPAAPGKSSATFVVNAGLAPAKVVTKAGY